MSAPLGAAVVLCGGKSSRMGRPKAWLPFDGEALLTRVTRLLSDCCAPLVVVAAPGQDLPPLGGSAEVVRDEIEGRGPLQGMSAGFAALEGRAEATFVTTTDAPFLEPALVRRLFALRELHPGGPYDVVIPKADGHHQPLCAVYAVALRHVVDDLLAQDRRRPFFLLERAKTLTAEAPLLLDDEPLRAADPTLRSLRNLNTPEDYEAALRELGKEDRA